MVTVKDILQDKHHQIFSVKPNDVVTLALETDMKDYRLDTKGNFHSSFLD